MTTPIPYVDVATVMGSTANGTIVPSAYGDQLRDNVMAIWYGWSFYATRVATLSVAASTWVQVPLTAFSTAYDSGVTTATDGMCSLSSGYVALNKAGVWLFNSYASESTALFAQSISVGTAVGLANSASDIHQETNTATVSGVFKVVTLPTYVGLWVFDASLSTLGGGSRLEGTWLGDA